MRQWSCLESWWFHWYHLPGQFVETNIHSFQTDARLILLLNCDTYKDLENQITGFKYCIYWKLLFQLPVESVHSKIGVCAGQLYSLLVPLPERNVTALAVKSFQPLFSFAWLYQEFRAAMGDCCQISTPCFSCSTVNEPLGCCINRSLSNEKKQLCVSCVRAVTQSVWVLALSLRMSFCQWSPP